MLLNKRFLLEAPMPLRSITIFPVSKNCIIDWKELMNFDRMMTSMK